MYVLYVVVYTTITLALYIECLGCVCVFMCLCVCVYVFVLVFLYFCIGSMGSAVALARVINK